MQHFDTLFERLAASSFRRQFHLEEKDFNYLQRKGVPTILNHAADFVEMRLADAHPKNDGKQTPWRGHPVFVAQHATGTCCRSCLQKWHGIRKGKPLNEHDKTYVAAVIEEWLIREISLHDSAD
jgi:hypothetical protein